MNVVLISIALLGILLFVLGANVTRNRVIVGKAGGDQAPNDPAAPLLVAQRAHGNAAEYVPTLAVLLFICGSQTDGWWLDALAVAAVVARFLHGFGMLASGNLAKRTFPKEFGAMLTYAVGIALGVTVLVTL